MDNVSIKTKFTGKIGEEIHTGIFGRVHKALWHNKTVVIKQMPENMARTDSFLQIESFAEEIALMRECKHPNIVTLLDSSFSQTDPQYCYMIMEWIALGDTADYLIAGNTFALDDIKSILSDTAQALFYLHKKRILHRDIKAENILIQRLPSGSLHAKLCDLGLALKLPEFTLSIKTNEYVGSLNYLAPEILTSQEYSRESDIYALAILGFVLITKTCPFGNHTLTNIADAVQIREKGPITKQTRALFDNEFQVLKNTLELGWSMDPSARPPLSDFVSHKPTYDELEKKPLCFYTSPPSSQDSLEDLDRSKSQKNDNAPLANITFFSKNKSLRRPTQDLSHLTCTIS